jgi:hypothetical protein
MLERELMWITGLVVGIAACGPDGATLPRDGANAMEGSTIGSDVQDAVVDVGLDRGPGESDAVSPTDAPLVDAVAPTDASTVDARVTTDASVRDAGAMYTCSGPSLDDGTAAVGALTVGSVECVIPWPCVLPGRQCAGWSDALTVCDRLGPGWRTAKKAEAQAIARNRAICRSPDGGGLIHPLLASRNFNVWTSTCATPISAFPRAWTVGFGSTEASSYSGTASESALVSAAPPLCVR